MLLNVQKTYEICLITFLMILITALTISKNDSFACNTWFVKIND